MHLNGEKANNEADCGCRVPVENELGELKRKVLFPFAPYMGDAGGS
jgi:hypothetical protein